jgi:hypothetical protein
LRSPHEAPMAACAPAFGGEVVFGDPAKFTATIFSGSSPASSGSNPMIVPTGQSVGGWDVWTNCWFAPKDLAYPPGGDRGCTDWWPPTGLRVNRASTRVPDYMKCLNCPCDDICLGWPAFCAWAAEDPPDDIKIQHIRARSAMTEAPIAVRPASPDDADRPGVTESLSLVKAMRVCPFRSTNTDCGCSGGRCALRRVVVVTHHDCFDCLRRYAGGH